MATAEGYLRRLTRRLTDDPEQLDVEELNEEAAGTGAQVLVSNGLGFEGWIDNQFNEPTNYLQPWVDWVSTNGITLQIYGNFKEFSWWNRVMGAPKLRPDSPTNTPPDFLRQRVAFALSEILVVSEHDIERAITVLVENAKQGDAA